MVELRWVMRGGEEYWSERRNQYCRTEREKVLQYRVQRFQYPENLGPALSAYTGRLDVVWSDWQDVPTVSETPQPTEAGSPQP